MPGPVRRGRRAAGDAEIGELYGISGRMSSMRGHFLFRTFSVRGGFLVRTRMFEGYERRGV